MDRSPTEELTDKVDIDALKKDARSTPYAAPGARIILAIGLLMMLVAIGSLVQSWMDDRDKAETRKAEAQVAQGQAKSLADAVIEACTDATKRTDDIEELCAKAVDTKREVAEEEPDPPAAVGISEDVVRAAVADFCTYSECRGPDGKPGANGEDAVLSSRQVAEAVADYCAAGACVGPEGAPGIPGAPASAEQIAVAVSAYCADGKCKGEPGKDGADGKNGDAGRGIRAVTCGTGNDWQITFTDGETATVPGPCRITTVAPTEPAPDPAPEPTPAV